MKHKTEIDNLIPGLGKITVTFDNDSTIPKYTISIHKLLNKIEIIGPYAIEHGKKLFGEESKFVQPVDKVIEIAQQVTGGNIEIVTKRRKEKDKLASYLIAWYLMRSGNTLKSAAEVINRSHAMVLHATELIEKEPKYRSKYENETILKFKTILDLL